MKYCILTLWDVDKTVVNGLGVHLEAFPYALEKVYGFQDFVRPEQHGLPDRKIVFDLARERKIDEKTIASKFPECLKEMANYFEANIDRYRIVAMPGARRVLQELEDRNVLKGLVTGNIEPVARGKIKKVGLERYFKLGSFGNESEERSDLVRATIRKAEEGFDFKANKENVYLFDDTPIGIKAGVDGRVRPVGVATGNHSMEQLWKAGAYRVLKDLKDTRKVLEVLQI